jgi:hypothetical protein
VVSKKEARCFPFSSRLCAGHGLAVLRDQEDVGLLGALADTRHDDAAHTALERGGHGVVELHAQREALGGGLPAVDGGQQRAEGAQHGGGVLLQVVDDGVGAGVKGVGGNGAAGGGVDGLDGAHGGARHVVHVEDGRVRVGAGGVERVGVAHGDLGKGGKVALGDGLLHGRHVGGHDRGDALLEQARRGDRLLHAARGADALLGGADDEYQGAHLGPVGGGGHLDGLGVEAIGLLAGTPGHVAAKQAAAGRAAALAGDQRQLRGRGRQLVQVGNGADEGGEAGGGRGETGGRGEVVFRDQQQLQVGELGQRGILLLEGGAEGAQLAQAGLGAGTLQVARGAIEQQNVLGVAVGARRRGQGAQVILRERHGERRVRGQIELGVPLAPVLDHGDVDGGRGAGSVDDHVGCGGGGVWQEIGRQRRASKGPGQLVEGRVCLLQVNVQMPQCFWDEGRSISLSP